FDPIRIDHPRTLLHRLQKCLIGFDLLRHNHNVVWRAMATLSHLQGDFLIDFGRKGAHWMIGSAVDCEEFIPHLEPRFRSGKSIEDPTDKGFISYALREHPDAWIRYLPIGKDPAYLAPECPGEDIEELVVGWIGWRVMPRM